MKGKEHRKEMLSNLRGLKAEELAAAETEAREKLFWLRFKQHGGQMEKPSEVRKTRRSIARLKTIQLEKSRMNANTKEKS